jgi:putative transposase
LRTFMTGLSNNNGFNIAPGINAKIVCDIKRLNKINNNKNIKNKIKKKNSRMINRKIKNKVDELHWKTIKMLTDSFSNILLGNMSSKSIVKRSSKILTANQKRACQMTRYYEFMMRLKYKCNATRTNFRYVDERYTSKLCSLCGHYNEKLKGVKIYNCPDCKQSMDRDINACRNILIKSML